MAVSSSLQSEVRVKSRPGAFVQGWWNRLPLLPALVVVLCVTQLPFVITLYYSLLRWNLVSTGEVGSTNLAQRRRVGF
jgi:sorbitol/mannitol transport system permease protein